MCGIVCAFDLKQTAGDLRPQLLEMSKKIRHRGPDWSGIYDHENAIMAHERLAIVDPASGKQPLLNADESLVLAANTKDPSALSSGCFPEAGSTIASRS